MKSGKVDIWLGSSIIVLLIIGLIMVFSASSMVAQTKHGSMLYYFNKQLLWVFLSVILLIGVSKIDYRKFKNGDIPLLLIGASLLMLALLLVFGRNINHSTRWFSIGGFFSFQPSEFAKLSLIIYFSYYLSSRGKKLEDFKTGLLPLILVLGAVVGLIFLQPDLSTSLTIVLITGSMLFISRAKLKHLLAIALSIVPVVVLMMTINPYQRGRFTHWLESFGNPLGAGYQIRQSLIGLGQGGWFGAGIAQSKQKFAFTPELHTDFIFSIIGEEFGFIGASLVLLLFLLILIRGMRVALKTKDSFAKFLAAGITLNIIFYAFINTSVASMLLPATGLPMPFISYGGSHLAFLGLSAGILLNISRTVSSADNRNNWEEFKENREQMNQSMVRVN
jgi:cell division protein FtsW